MTIEIVIVGAGGFGREALDVAIAMHHANGAQFDIIGVIDDRPSDENRARLDARGVPLLGRIDSVPEGRGVQVAIAIGDPSIRASIARDLEARGFRPVTLIHPSAVIGSRSIVGEGAIICSGVQISTNVRIGRHTHINPSATVGHDSIIDDVVSINPGAVVSGDVLVQSEALIGAGAVVLQGVTVGRRSVVGAAACVVRDVADGSTVKGVPAR